MENTKLVAQNTLFLYFRSILVLGVGLYTSREILAQLGVSDFGIYNIVGSVIVLFSFIQSAMYSATSRFFTFDLGKGDFEQLKKTFCLSVSIHVFTAFLILILGETAGLWFLNTQLVIPAERIETANFVYQFTIFTACIGILQMPYTIAINAHEKMKIYAYAGIIEVILKLAIVLTLGFVPFDKLKIYSILLFAVYALMNIFYFVYCHLNFKETHFEWFMDKKLFLDRIKFSGFEFLGVCSHILVIQGGSILINKFYGVLLNAANGISVQVTGAVSQFSNNLLQAFTPQITKSLATNEMNSFFDIIIRSSKFCFLLSFVFTAPLILQIDFILKIWLKEVPEYANIFCMLSLINCLMYTYSMPIWQGIISTGNNKKFRIVDGVMNMLIFLLTYIGLHFSPVYYMHSLILVNIFKISYALLYLHNITKFSIRDFVNQSLTKCFVILVISIPLPLLASIKYNGLHGFLICLSTFFPLYILSSYFIGLNKSERLKAIDYVKRKIHLI
ncbi:MAG: hypothetical protein LBC64_01350 [Fibromonadaceae bacterium]|jgi:O-antigen/teichoic acid export membrane protein|nr:hypothetical protein [Fibromonadaceae bacterium]